MYLQYRQRLILGFLCGAGTALPLFGQIFGVPSSVISLLLPFATILILMGRAEKNTNRFFMAVPALAILFAFCVFAAANDGQVTYLMQPERWRGHAASYQEAKLFTFLVSFIGPFALAWCFTEAAGVRDAVTGVLVAVICVAALAAVRLLLFHGSSIIGSDMATARVFFADNAVGFSIVSYGILFALGGVAALVFKKGWIASGVFMFLAALISRRAETLSIGLAIIAFTGFQYWHTRARDVVLKGLGSLAIAACLFGVAHNEHNLTYFSNYSNGWNQRVELAEATNESVAPPITSSQQDASGEAVRQEPGAAPQQTDTGSRVWGEGHGLGSFSDLNQFAVYPHNVLLETLYELGLGALIVLSLMIAVPFVLFFWQVATGQLQSWMISILGMAVVVTAISLKAGDISSVGRIAFFCTVAACSLWPNKAAAGSPLWLRRLMT